MDLSVVVTDGVTINNAPAMAPDDGMPALVVNGSLEDNTDAMAPDDGMPALVVNGSLDDTESLDVDDEDPLPRAWPDNTLTLVEMLKWYEHCQLGGSKIAHWHISFGQPEFKFSSSTVYRYHHWIAEVGHDTLRAFAVALPGVTVRRAFQEFALSW